MAAIQKSTNNECCRVCGEKRPLVHCWWECQLVQPVWRTVWRVLKKLEIELPYDPAIPLLGIHTKETRIERDTCTPMFIAALFIIARTWKQPRCPSADEWIRKLWYIYTMEYSIQLSRSVMSNSLQPHGLQHARPPCPSPTPGVYPNLSPLSQWCHPTISSFVVPFSSRLQSFPASGSFPISQLFTSGGQSYGASASVLPMNIQNWFPFGLTGLISLQSKGLSRVFSNTTVQKHQFFSTQLSLWSNPHIHTWVLEKSLLWLCGCLLAKWYLCFLIGCLGWS